jgi:hypothetical protein
MNRFYVFVSLVIFSSIIPGCRDDDRISQISGDVIDKDWKIFRGSPDLTGLSNDRIPDQPNLLWSFQTEYEIKSSPVIGYGKYISDPMMAGSMH